MLIKTSRKMSIWILYPIVIPSNFYYLLRIIFSTQFYIFQFSCLNLMNFKQITFFHRFDRYYQSSSEGISINDKMGWIQIPQSFRTKV